MLDNASQKALDYKVTVPADAEVNANPDGTLTVLKVGPNSLTVIGTITKPWAVDANGVNLAASYSYDAGVLTQHVDTDGAAFPVVADPSYSVGFWYGIPVAWTQYTWSEMWRLKSRFNNEQLFATTLCSALPKSGAVACALLAGLQYNDIRNNIDYGLAHRRCLKSRVPFDVIPIFVVAYDAYTVRCSS